jgi:hypothetical protein
MIQIVLLILSFLASDAQVGTWKLNVAKSKYGGPAPQASINKIEAVEGGIRLIADNVDATGKSSHDEYTVKYDGKDHPVKTNPARTIAYRKIDDYTFEAVGKNSGRITTTARLIYSKDGKTRTVIATSIDGDGKKSESTRVYDRHP